MFVVVQLVEIVDMCISDDDELDHILSRVDLPYDIMDTEPSQEMGAVGSPTNETRSDKGRATLEGSNRGLRTGGNARQELSLSSSTADYTTILNVNISFCNSMLVGCGNKSVHVY